MAGYEGIEGIAWAYRFSKTGVAELVEGPALLEALEKQEAWLWVNFDLAHERASVAITALPHLPAGALDMLCTGDERQQIDGFGQAMGGVVADYKALDPVDEKLVARWNFVIAPYAFLSAGRHASHALNRVRIDLQSGRRFADVVALFHALIQEVATAISLVLGEVGSKLNEMEERALDQKEIGPDVLGQARRRLVRLRRQAAPLRGLLIRMLSERPYWFDGDAVIGCQRVIARMDALIDDLDSYQERARTLQDELKAREAEETNKRLAVLAIVSALLLPPTFFTGVFGMNMAGMPFQQSAYGFWIACAFMVASVVGMLVMLKRIRLI
jgi:Mg2+ and Co2+ transporter CorA